jgi:SAM-dependent methyltransferase
MSTPSQGTDTVAYANYLEGANVFWKRALGVQRLYAWSLRSLRPGFMLEVGCGVGRCLKAVRGNGVGVDHNPTSVAIARARGFEAFTPDDFRASPYGAPGRFDSLLVSHVLEHMSELQAQALLASYLPYVRTGGALIVITPQERGFDSDATHERFVGFAEIDALANQLGLRRGLQRSFPFPRPVGKWFTYNEFVAVAHKP